MATAWIFGIVATFGLLLQEQMARGHLAIALPLGLMTLLTGRHLLRRNLARKRSNGEFTTRIVVLGNPASIESFCASLGRVKSSGCKVVGACVPDCAGEIVSESEYPVVLAAADVLLLHEKPGVTEMSLPSKLTSYARAARPILAAVEDRGITKALLDSYGAAVTTQCGDPSGLLGALRLLTDNPTVSSTVVAAAETMAHAEFSAERGRECFRQFAYDLVQGAR